MCFYKPTVNLGFGQIVVPTNRGPTLIFGKFSKLLLLIVHLVASVFAKFQIVLKIIL